MPETIDHILIYEDSIARGRRFLPLTYTRCLAELRSGLYTGIERVRRVFPQAEISLHTTPQLRSVVAARYDLPVNQWPKGETLLLNAREAVSCSGESLRRIAEERTHRPTAQERATLEAGNPLDLDFPLADMVATSVWEMVLANPRSIEQDIRLLRTSGFPRIDPTSLKHSAIEKPQDLFIHRHAKIGAFTVFDCTAGPIVIEEGARIFPQTTILGPAVIGKKTLVKIGTKIYGGTTIGPVCKVGGEIENSIVQGYSNKQHDGYLGHSFLGEWCNLGAGTNTSDLKNDYSPVRLMIEGEEFNTGSLFAGLLMGDHAKSGIGVQFNTGTVVGVSCNIFDAGFPPKWIPNFSWGSADGLVPYRFEKVFQVASAVMKRRSVEMSEKESILLRALYEESVSKGPQ